jgi:hypothetical protein
MQLDVTKFDYDVTMMRHNYPRFFLAYECLG